MRSRTSCFNGTVFRKNLTRFAPVMALYTLVLVLLIFMAWSNSGDLERGLNFTYQINGIFEVTGCVNLIYAGLIAQLLFGDLYNTRMCNALHAMPLRRESWFVTNAASGLVYSLVPSVVASVVLLPFLRQTVVDGVWKIALLYFVSSNLEYICFFGLALFATMLVGNRFTMVAGYALLNFGSGALYWLVRTAYTPMLYGVVTPSALATSLMPLSYMTNGFLKFDIGDCRDDFGRLIPGVRGTFEITDNVNAIWVLALVGIAFAVAALLVYRRRNLECAGDAVCSPKLVPVFQVLSALFVAVGILAILDGSFGDPGAGSTYVILFVGLLVGWFAGKMLVERSVQVFQPKNWIGLGALALVLAVSLGLTKLDVLNLEERMPELETVTSVTLNGQKLEDREDIEKILNLHALALEDRVEQEGAYCLEENGEYVRWGESSYRYWEEGDPIPQQRLADCLRLDYTLENGRHVKRNYCVWTDTPAGGILKDFLTSWEFVNDRTIDVDGKKTEALPLVLATLDKIYCNGKTVEAEDLRSSPDSLIRAIQADCAAGTMAQNSRYHEGEFTWTDAYGDTNCQESLYLSLSGTEYGWEVEVYPDSTNTLRWMRQNGLIADGVTVSYEITHPRYW